MHYEGLQISSSLQGPSSTLENERRPQIRDDSIEANNLHAIWKKEENAKEMQRILSAIQGYTKQISAVKTPTLLPSLASMPFSTGQSTLNPTQELNKSHLTGTQSMPCLTGEDPVRQSVSSMSWSQSALPTPIELCSTVDNTGQWAEHSGGMITGNGNPSQLPTMAGTQTNGFKLLKLSHDQQKSRRSLSAPTSTLEEERNQVLSSANSFPGRHCLQQTEFKDLNPLSFKQTRDDAMTLQNSQDTRLSILDMLNRASSPMDEFDNVMHDQQSKLFSNQWQTNQLDNRCEFNSISMIQSDHPGREQKDIQFYTERVQQRRQSLRITQRIHDVINTAHQYTTGVQDVGQFYTRPTNMVPALNDSKSGQLYQDGNMHTNAHRTQQRRHSVCGNVDLKKTGRGRVKSSSRKKQECAHCKTTTTTTWRRHERQLVCNACGLYFKTKGRMRPLIVQQKAKQYQNQHMNIPF
ncbi:hypothetical protein SARC_11272 [Sphaeroforma arctica JP610]|uniref:GATA-type domain-containing protein n=1 Tax=Sphaeroforma arctica JP610 TaxID=667725 RepID=A0A0L0FIC6_9EUKA|nr:hypothetical protein SARC_11272 [Sphaeroforma arctica JP610]KNC76216.1 hypothetical protein SARC_11272 [Sphaeroforma arctica JP610]|eukprot:XP_014150118.1 hypothetical protein SARC_11272 [Sphaeroforma arctica JP610]